MGRKMTPCIFCSMIYLALKFEFNAVVSFRNRSLNSIGSKLWTRMEHVIDLLAILKANVDRTIFHYNL